VTRRIVYCATSNPGKLREFQLAAPDFDVRALPTKVEPPEEHGSSFEENAIAKAEYYGGFVDGYLFADDSGLEVDALGGAPGVYSARYAGAGADDAANNSNLLQTLAGMGREQRTARYRCALAFVSGASHEAPLVAEGIWEGIIVDTPRGSGGFGYDPYFWLPDLGVTAAELAPSDKNRLSHRGKALRALRDQLMAREQSSGRHGQGASS